MASYYCTIKWREQDDILSYDDFVAVDTSRDHVGDIVVHPSSIDLVPFYFFTGDIDYGNTRPAATLVNNEELGGNFFIAYSPDGNPETGLHLTELEDIDGDGADDPLIFPQEDPSIPVGDTIGTFPYAIYIRLSREYFDNVGIDIDYIVGETVVDPIYLPLYIAGDTLEITDEEACCEEDFVASEPGVAEGAIQTIKLHGWTASVDTTPTITVLGDNPLTLEVGSVTSYTDPGASAVSYDGTNLTSLVVASGDIVDPDVVGTYNVNYDVVDPENGGTDSATRVVNVIHVYIFCSTDADCPAGYHCEQGVCVEDMPFGLCDNDSDCPDGYTCVGGECLDNMGLPPNPCEPTITIVGDNPLTMDITPPGEANYNDPGATAIGSACQSLTGDVVVSGQVPNSSIEGVYAVKYNVTDPVTGIAANEMVRTVNIVIPPSCTIYISHVLTPFAEGLTPDLNAAYIWYSSNVPIAGLQFSHDGTIMSVYPTAGCATPDCLTYGISALGSITLGQAALIAFDLAGGSTATPEVLAPLMDLHGAMGLMLYNGSTSDWLISDASGDSIPTTVVDELSPQYISDPSANLAGDTYDYDANFGSGGEGSTASFTIDSRPDEIDDDIGITRISCTPVPPYKVAHKWVRHFDGVNDLIENNPDLQAFFTGLDESAVLDVRRYLDDLVYTWAQETLRNATFADNNDIGQWITSAVELTLAADGGAKELIKMLSPAGNYRNFDDLYCGDPAYITIQSVTNMSLTTGYPSIRVEFVHHIPEGASTIPEITNSRYINWRLETVDSWGPDTIVGSGSEVSAPDGLMGSDGDTLTIDIDLSEDNLGAHAAGYTIAEILAQRDQAGNLGKYIIKAALMDSDNTLWEEGIGLTSIASSDIIEIGDPIESMAVYPLAPASGAPTAGMNYVQFAAMAQYSWRAEMVDAGIPDRLKVNVSDSVLWNILPGTEGDDTAPNATVDDAGQVNIIDIGGDGTIDVVAAWTGRDDDYTNTSSTITKISEVTIFGDGWDEGPDIIDFATDLLDDLSPVPYSFTVRTHYDTETHHMTETDYTWTVSASTIGGTPVVVEFSEWSEITDNTSKFHFTIPVSTGAGTGEDIVITVQTEHDSGVVVAEGGVASNVVDTYQITVTPVPVAGTLQLQLVEVLPGYSDAEYVDTYDEDSDNIYLPDSRLITNSVTWGLTDLLEGPGMPVTPEMVDLIERGGGSISEGQTTNSAAPSRLIKWATHHVAVNQTVFGATPETNSVAWSALVDSSAQPWWLMPNTPPDNVPEVCTICVCDYYRFKALVGFGVDNVPDYIEVGGLDKTTVGGYEHEIELYILAAEGADGTAYPVNDGALSGLSVSGIPMIEVHSSDNGPLVGDDFNSPGTAVAESLEWVYFKFTNDALGWTFRPAASIKDHANPAAPQNSFPVISANTSYGDTADDELAITLYVDPCTNAQLRWDYYDLGGDWTKVLTDSMPGGTWHNTEKWYDVNQMPVQPIIYTEKVGSVMSAAGYIVESGEEGMGEYHALNTLCIRCPDTWKFLNLLHWFDRDPCNISPDVAMPTISYEVILDPATPIDEIGTDAYNTYENVPFINYKASGEGESSYDIEPPRYPAPMGGPISGDEAAHLCDTAAGPEYCGGYSYVFEGETYSGYRHAVVAVDSPDKTIDDIDLNHPQWDIWIEEHTHTGDGSPLPDRIGVKVVTANTPGVYYIRAMINGDVNTATSWAAYRYVDCPIELKLPGTYDTECIEYLDSIDGSHSLTFQPGVDAGDDLVSGPVIDWASGASTLISAAMHPTFKNAISWYVDGVKIDFDGLVSPIVTFPATDIDWGNNPKYTLECRIDTAGNMPDASPSDGVLDITDLQDAPGGAESTFMAGMNFRLAQTGDELLCPEGSGTAISVDVIKSFTRPANNCEGCDGELALDLNGCCPDEAAMALTEGCGCDETGVVIYSAANGVLADGTPIDGNGCCPPLEIDNCGQCNDPLDLVAWNSVCRGCLDPDANNTVDLAISTMFNVDCAGMVGGDDYSCCEYNCMIDSDCPPHAACCREGGELLGSPLPNYCEECPTSEELRSCLFAWLEFLLADEAGSGLFTGAIPPAYAAEGLGSVRAKLESGVYTVNDVNAAFQAQCETNPDCSWVNWGGDTIGGNCGCLCGGGWDPGGGFGGGLGGGDGSVDPGGDGFGGGGGFEFEFESDKDLKNIIREIPVEEQTKDYHLLGLKVYEYEWLPIAKALYGVEGHVAEGVLAEDVESTFPALGKPDGDPDDGDLWWHDYPLEPESGWGEFAGKVHSYYNHVNFTLLHQMIEEAKK